MEKYNFDYHTLIFYRGKGLKLSEIAEKMGYSRVYISHKMRDIKKMDYEKYIKHFYFSLE